MKSIARRRVNEHAGWRMRPGDEIELEITDLAYGGDGIARHEGRVIFAPFTIPGEKVAARVTEVHRNYARVSVATILAPSPDRVAPPCPVFTLCGGCAYQHIAYPRQLEIKTRQVSEALRRIGKITEPRVEPARLSPEAYHYRNRITVHVEPPDVGFRGTDPRRLIDVKECLIAEDGVNAALAALRSKRHLRPGPATLRTNPEQTGFRQVNNGAAEVLAAAVSELAGEGTVLLDAYCGSGFFSKHLLGAFGSVIGIDWDERSTNQARSAADAREMYFTGDVALLLPQLLVEHHPQVVLLDPPAQGVAQEVIEGLLATSVPRIVYVSCDPATLARDIAKLSSGYNLVRAIPVDMFPQTASIETAALLQLR
jgi:23S rRNA (uracil1939-C5)-methyltransferase